MKKIFLVLFLLVIGKCVALQASDSPSQDDAKVTVGVISPLIIDVMCPYCEANLPDIIIGTTITVPKPISTKAGYNVDYHMIAFKITGQPGEDINVDTDGPTYVNNKVTMTGRWGSFANGSVIDDYTGGAWETNNVPETLGAASSDHPGIAYYNFIVDQLSAANDATGGVVASFTLNISAEYKQL